VIDVEIFALYCGHISLRIIAIAIEEELIVTYLRVGSPVIRVCFSFDPDRDAVPAIERIMIRKDAALISTIDPGRGPSGTGRVSSKETIIYP